MDATQNNIAIFILSDLDDYGLSADEFRILARVARRGDCTESVASMSESTHISDRQVRYALRVLVACRILAAEERIGATTIYRIRPLADWVTPEEYLAVRKATLIPNPDKKPLHKGAAATAGGTAGGAGLQEVQGRTAQDAGGTAATAAKGNPSKVIPEGNPITATDSATPHPPQRSRRKPADVDSGYTDETKQLRADCAATFRVEYKSIYGKPAQLDGHDFTFWHRLWVRLGDGLVLTEWELACRNYLATPQSSHTMADLCDRYDVFCLHALDRYGKPVGGNGNVKQSETRGERNIRNLHDGLQRFGIVKKAANISDDSNKGAISLLPPVAGTG